MNDKKILVIDDSRFARVILKRALANGDYTNIVEAATAAEAVAVFKAEQPDLTFLDISLPDSDDLGLLTELLGLKPDAKIVMCSALGQNLIIEDALKKGALDFIIKPFEEKQLLDTTGQLLSQEG